MATFHDAKKQERISRAKKLWDDKQKAKRERILKFEAKRDARTEAEIQAAKEHKEKQKAKIAELKRLGKYWH